LDEKFDFFIDILADDFAQIDEDGNYEKRTEAYHRISIDNTDKVLSPILSFDEMSTEPSP
jgi:hypothetical protein